ncbi:Putative Catalytic activity: nitrate reductases catalyse the reaction [[Torrubiella] hemipterigena]|uniref:Putative Catalytic activity: nitrate reductases catalyse the reaction n=1 Tax=[Torrubiella] hemipterigena TaxID=1531966 RepID=A0A0A1T572_9HYPO|nr:Putative Catalytic activity: nitrate reductases catalyse the reaction [[Torrubiella] hemipterigena]
MEYDARQVAEHKSGEDAWFIIHGQVYDVTKYLADHPGGADVLIEAAGTDASEAFDNAGHSEDAFEVMDTYKVGKLKGAQKAKPKPKPMALVKPPAAAAAAQNKGTTLSQTGAKLINLSLFAAAVGATYYAARHHGPAIPKWMLHLVNNETPGKHGHGFTKGLLVGGSVFAVVDYVLAQHFFKLLWGNSRSFTTYPAHMKIPKIVQEDTLLQRGLLDPVTYSHLPLQAKTMITPNVYRFTFTLPDKTTILGLPIGQHVAIKADIDGESVARSYTPVSNNVDLGIIELVIKVYPDGKLTSKYLANLQVGDEVLFRGPKGAMRYHRDLCDKIGMVAGGTGITPMYQLIRAICEDDRDLTEVSLIYANRSEEDILLRKELDAFARRYPKNFKVYYMLDQPPADWAYGKGYVTKDLMEERLPAPSAQTKMMLCGPPGMVNAAKKSLVSLGFEQPGAASKMTDQIFLF